MEFIVFDIWGGVAHEMTRLPARVEWVVWNGFQTSFSIHGRYQQDDIRMLSQTLFKANAELWKGQPRAYPKIDACLETLSKAEKLLSEDGRSYFRTQLMRMIGQRL